MVKSLQSESTCKVYHSSLFYVKLNGIFVPILSHDKEARSLQSCRSSIYYKRIIGLKYLSML